MGTLYVRLDFPVSTSSLRPSNSMICPGNGPKRPPEAPNADSHKPRIGHILATWLKMPFRGHLLHPQPPTYCGFHPSKLHKRTPRPQYLGPLGRGKLQAQAQTGGCPNGSTGASRGKKMRSATCESRSRPPPLSFPLNLCVIVLHTHRHHPPKILPISRVLLLACCLLLPPCLLAAAKPGRSTLDTKKAYKTKTGSTSSVTLTLTPPPLTPGWTPTCPPARRPPDPR